MRFGMRALLVTVGLVAIACYVWAAPVLVRVPVLFVAVLVMPGPLVVLWRQGGRGSQAFALGSLVAYGLWFVVGGIPCAAFVAYRFMKGAVQVPAPNPSIIQWNIEGYIGNYYPGYIGLYAPCIIVPLAGALALMVHWLAKDRISD